LRPVTVPPMALTASPPAMAVEPRRLTVVLGVPVDDVTLDEAVDRIMELVEVGRRRTDTKQVATVNVDFLVNASRDRRLLELLQRAALSIPDGMPVVWASRLLGTPIRERTTGVDLLPALARRAAATGHRIVVFGGSEHVAAAAVDAIRSAAPGASIAGLGGMAVAADGTMDEAWVGRLRALRPDIVCVALGNPKQEHWIARYGATIGAPVAIGIGGTLDFLTGTTRRAPGWMRRRGLEWLHRAISEPRRLAGRYALDLAVFGPGLLRQCWRGRRRGEAVVPPVVEGAFEVVVRLAGPLPRARTDPAVLHALADGKHLVIDVAGLARLDNVTVAGLLELMHCAVDAGVGCTVRGASPPMVAGARRLGVDTLLASPIAGTKAHVTL
jgi:N-acetylglucosaminyldiphosphoundecaprenol N-acetyl-beta-D-mannosaminyltransferase